MDNIIVELNGESGISHQLRSDIGSREEQQDRAYFYSDPVFTFAAVCDGMGGTENGAGASKIALDTMQTLIKDYIANEQREDLVTFFQTVLAELDNQVFCRLGRKKGGTTTVAAAICDRNLYWLSAGDSRLYILRNGELVQATRDHNYYLRLNEQLHNGEIDQETFQQESSRGEALISYIGMGGLTLYDLTTAPLPLLKGDILLLTTDGLCKAVPDELIQYILSKKLPLPKKADKLLSQVTVLKTTAALDNTTFALIEI